MLYFVVVLLRIDERWGDDFYKSISESESFLSGEDDDVFIFELWEVKSKLRRKEELFKVKFLVEVLLLIIEKSKINEDGLVLIKVEILFDISEREDELDDEKFFEFEDNEESESEFLDFEKYWLDKEDVSVNESE